MCHLNRRGGPRSSRRGAAPPGAWRRQSRTASSSVFGEEAGFPSTPLGLAGFGLRFPQVRLSAFPRVHILSTFLPCVLAALKTGKEITLFGIKVFHDLPGPSCPEFSGRRWRKLENRELQG